MGSRLLRGVVTFAAANAAVVWNWSQLTPTGFPTALDWAIVVPLAAGTFVMARSSSLPGWAFVAYGVVAADIVLCANFHDNNFRANIEVQMLPFRGVQSSPQAGRSAG